MMMMMMMMVKMNIKEEKKKKFGLIYFSTIESNKNPIDHSEIAQGTRAFQILHNR